VSIIKENPLFPAKPKRGWPSAAMVGGVDYPNKISYIYYMQQPCSLDQREQGCLVKGANDPKFADLN
jgi:hypothetical protein